jgi:drug/metabolite transporter (DMT)-like permease
MHLWAVAEALEGRARGGARSDAAGYAAGLATWLIGASVLVVAHALAGEMPPWTLCCTRSLIPALVLLPLVARHRKDAVAFLRSHWREAGLIGAMGLGLTQGVMFTALGLTSAVNVAIVFGLTPLITMALARVLLGEPMNGWQALGSAIAFAGIVTICVQGSLARLLGFDIGLGDLLALGAAFLFAGYTVLLKRAKFDLPRIPLLVILLSAGSLASLPFAVWEHFNGAHDDMTLRGYGALIYCGIIGGALTYFLYNTSIEILGAARAGNLLYTQMIFVALLSWIFLGAALEWYHYLGAGLVISGVLVVTLLRSRTPQPQAAAG